MENLWIDELEDFGFGRGESLILYGGCGKAKNLKLKAQNHSVKFKSGYTAARA